MCFTCEFVLGKGTIFKQLGFSFLFILGSSVNIAVLIEDCRHLALRVKTIKSLVEKIYIKTVVGNCFKTACAYCVNMYFCPAVG